MRTGDQLTLEGFPSGQFPDRVATVVEITEDVVHVRMNDPVVIGPQTLYLPLALSKSTGYPVLNFASGHRIKDADLSRLTEDDTPPNDRVEEDGIEWDLV